MTGPDVDIAELARWLAITPRAINDCAKRGIFGKPNWSSTRSTDRKIKITVPGPFTMAPAGPERLLRRRAEMVLDYAAAVNAEIKDLFAAGADIVHKRDCAGFRRASSKSSA